MMEKRKKQVIVVGGGLAGLAAAMKLAEKNISVKLISVTKVRRSHSVCAQGGINVAVDLKGEKTLLSSTPTRPLKGEISSPTKPLS